MDRAVIIHIGAEGGAITICGGLVAGSWVFWRETTEMLLDENDEDYWQSSTSKGVSDLLTLLPPNWWKLYPLEIHPRFAEALRRDYDARRAASELAGPGNYHHQRWLALFAGEADQQPDDLSA